MIILILTIQRVLGNAIITHPETNRRIALFMLEFLNQIVHSEIIKSNYIMFMLVEGLSRSYRGDEGDYVERFWMELDSDCSTCGAYPSQISLSVTSTSLLQDLIDAVSEQISHPFSLWMGTTSIYADVGKEIIVYQQKPRALHEATERNLSKTLASLHLYDGDSLSIHASSASYTLTLEFTAQLPFIVTYIQ